ncbi:hypothetical protein C8Q77DRAFT_455944 [Trametes polyzona]|nr:hypothetical protein C8Q77DRAFT_455944 [Trametes polyzona]
MRLTQQFLALAALVPISLLSPAVQAGGVIACHNGRVNGGRGDIPTHNPEFFDGSDTYIGGPFADDCGEMIGARADPTKNWSNGNGKTVSASFWITNDLCMNVEVNGVHHFCCPSKINQGSSDTTTCNWT